VQYRALGDSDLRVSEICLGRWTPEQLRDNAADSGVGLDAGTMRAIDAVFA
jgi:hypothetical protein